jgi:hypothetical protein
LRTQEQRNVAQEQRDLAEKRLVQTQAAEALAQQKATEAKESEQLANEKEQQATALNEFLTEDLLGQAAPDQHPRGQKVSVEQVVLDAAKKIDELDPKTHSKKEKFKDPKVEATIRHTIGSTLYRLGAYEQGEKQLLKAVKIREQVLGKDKKETLVTTSELGELYWAKGDLDRAIFYTRRALDGCHRVMQPEDDATLTAQNNLALELESQGKPIEAEEHFREQLKIRSRVKKPDRPGTLHPYTLNGMNNLARDLLDQGKWAEGEELLREALAYCRVSIPNDPIICAVMSNFGVALTEQGKFGEADSQLKEALAECIRIQGPDHRYTLITRNNINRLLIRQGKLAEAEKLCRQNLADCQRQIGAEHPKTCVALDNLATVLLEKDKLAEAEPLINEALLIRQKRLPAGHYERALSDELKGRLLLRKGLAEQAEPLLREGWNLRRDNLCKGNGQTAVIESLFGSALSQIQRYDEAERRLLESYELMKAASDVSPRERQEAVSRLIALYTAWGKLDEAGQWKAQLTPAEPAKP